MCLLAIKNGAKVFEVLVLLLLMLVLLLYLKRKVQVEATEDREIHAAPAHKQTQRKSKSRLCVIQQEGRKEGREKKVKNGFWTVV